MSHQNPYTKNINRIEFVVTNACTGRCKHCSQGEHSSGGAHIEGEAAEGVVYQLCSEFQIKSLMTFGGEPLLYLDEVCKIHAAAREMNIPERSLITNGFFCKDKEKIKEAAARLVQSGVNGILLSVDAFHQETIPLCYVKEFAMAVKDTGTPFRINPAWLVSRENDNPYNNRTAEILKEFEAIGVPAHEGNVIFPSGNALKYLGEYFDPEEKYIDPYEEDSYDIRTVSVSADGAVLGGNIYQTDILEIVKRYRPEE